MNLIAKLDGIDADEWIDWLPFDDTVARYNFTVATGRIPIIGRNGPAYIDAPRVIMGGIAHGRLVYTKDERKRITKEPPDLSLIASSNGRVESMPRNRNVLSKPRHGEDGVPRFDKGCFKRDKGDLKFVFLIGHIEEHLTTQRTGECFVATWQFQRVGNASPTVAHKVGTDLSREQLDRIARPSDRIRTEQSFKLADESLHCFPLAVLPWNAHAKHLPWVNRDAAEVERNAKRYRRRLDNAAKGYDDLLRWNGKCKCRFDETRTQAAWREQQERLFGRESSDEPDGYLDKNSGEDWKDAWQDYYVPALPWVLAFQPTWFFVGVLAPLFPKAAARYLPPSYYAHLEGTHDERARTIGNRCLSEEDVLSDEALGRKGGKRFSIRPRWYDHCLRRRKNVAAGKVLSDKAPVEARGGLNGKGRKSERKRVTFLEPDEILPAVIAAKQGIAARNKLIDHYRPGIATIAARYASAAIPAEDLINQAIIGTPSENGEVTNGLLYAIEKFDPENGGTWGAFMKGAIKWAILKYIEQQPKHISLTLNAKINPADDDDDAATWQDFVVVEGSDHGEEYEAA
jgi:hypothetical protein